MYFFDLIVHYVAILVEDVVTAPPLTGIASIPPGAWAIAAVFLGLATPIIIKMIDVTRGKREAAKAGHDTETAAAGTRALGLAVLDFKRESAEWQRIDQKQQTQDNFMARAIQGYYSYAQSAGKRVHLMNGEVARLQAVANSLYGIILKNNVVIEPEPMIFNQTLYDNLAKLDDMPPAPIEEVLKSITQTVKNGGEIVLDPMKPPTIEDISGG